MNESQAVKQVKMEVSMKCPNCNCHDPQGYHDVNICLKNMWEIQKVLTDAVKFALVGYRNILELNLMPEQYNDDTEKQIEELSSALFKIKNYTMRKE